MPDISLLQPLVLRGILERFTTPETLTMLSTIPQTPNPFPTAQWEVVRGARAVAKPNVPNSEAHIVPRLGRSAESAAFVYLREKKVFEPTTLHWLRQAANSISDLATSNAEAAVLREVGDLNTRFDNFAEWMIWQALTGTLVFNFPDVQASVDYKFMSSHKPTTTWTTAADPATQIINDVKAWKRLIARDGRVQAQDAYVTDTTMSFIFGAFAKTGVAVTATTGSPASPGGAVSGNNLMSDRMKDQYYSTGTLPGFLGLNWSIQENVYDATDAAYTANPTDPGAETRFVADNAVYLGNYTDNRPVELMIGPSADDEAPDNFTGKFTKTWKDKDPSARQILLEWNLLPVITRPEQLVFATYA